MTEWSTERSLVYRLVDDGSVVSAYGDPCTDNSTPELGVLWASVAADRESLISGYLSVDSVHPRTLSWSLKNLAALGSGDVDCVVLGSFEEIESAVWRVECIGCEACDREPVSVPNPPCSVVTV